MMILLIAIAAGLVVGPMQPPPPPGWETAPARPVDHKAPRDLQEAAVEWCCNGQGLGTQACKDNRGHIIRARTHDLHWVGLWYMQAWRLPGAFEYWPVAHSCRESRGKVGAVGDRGTSVGLFQLKYYPWVGWWKDKAKRHLDRLDPFESARALSHGVALSYRTKVDRACPGTKLDKLRLAAVRTTRSGFTTVGIGKVPRCDFMVLHRDGIMRPTGGLPVAWAQKAWDLRNMARLIVKR